VKVASRSQVFPFLAPGRYHPSKIVSCSLWAFSLDKLHDVCHRNMRSRLWYSCHQSDLSVRVESLSAQSPILKYSHEDSDGKGFSRISRLHVNSLKALSLVSEETEDGATCLKALLRDENIFTEGLRGSKNDMRTEL